MFSDVNLWYAHKQKEHPDLASRVLLTEDLFACGICQKQFRKIPLLRRHERYHVTERPYKCEKCGCSFVAKEDLKAHLKVHSGEKPFQCPYCKFSTLRKPALTAHMRVHDESQHLYCPHCNRKYVNVPSLRKHLRSAHNATKEEEDQVLDAIQQQETVYLKIEHDTATEDGETLIVAPDPNHPTDDHTQVIHIQNLSDVGHEIGALIQDTSTLIKSQNPVISTGQVQELVVSDQASVVQPQIVIQESQEAPEQQFIQEQEIDENQQQVYLQQELVAAEGQQFEELETVAAAGIEEGQGDGEQEVVYIMAEGEGGEDQATGQMIQAKDENGQDVLYLKVAENQYIQVMDTQSFGT